MAEAEMTATPLDQATDNDRASPLTTNRNLNEQVTELRVTAHLMALDRGLFCVLCRPVAGSEEDGSGLPGVRISLPPGHSPEVVSISTFRSDGWLGVADGAALIRVNGPRGQILVTIYQNPRSHPESAPRIQVLRLASEPEPVATQLPQSEAAERPNPGRRRSWPTSRSSATSDRTSAPGSGERGASSGSKGLEYLRLMASSPRTSSIEPFSERDGCRHG